MRIISSSTHFLLLVLALMSAFGAAVTVAYNIDSWKNKTVTVVVEPKKIETSTVVIAAEQLRFGTELTKANLREMVWPTEALPHGAITKVADLLKRKGKTVALSYMEIGEPVLNWKITGPGQRASLSAMLKEETKAVSIRVNAVLGVGGFVLPGDHVDVLLTREEEVSIDNKVINRSYTDVLLQNIRVLAVDQIADDKKDKPELAKTVTVEVGITEAQKLVLASSVGVLSLTLRRAGALFTDNTRRITLADLAFGDSSRTTKVETNPVKKAPQSRAAKVSITRALDKIDYTVYRE